ncbi:MAG: insulinase family protein [Clostridia bacterium]|nr:insulinase family protein [Clostridia bacterium]
MITKSIQIANGVKINYIQTDKFKTNTFSFNFITQIRKDSAYLNTLLVRLLTHGSASYPSQMALEKKLQYLYAGTVAKKTSSIGKYQIFGVLADMLNDRYTEKTPVTDEAIDLLCDIIFNPLLENGAFSAQYTEDEKSELIDIINAEINNTARYSQNRCIEIMCENEIFSIKTIGTVEQVNSVKQQMLYDAYFKALRECRIEIYVVGNVDIDKIASKFKSFFDKIERKPEIIDDIDIVRCAAEVKNEEEIQDVSQGKLVMGFRTGKTIEDGDFHIAQLFNEVFGGSPSSKLFVNVREKKSLCYTCRSFVTQKEGFMCVTAGIEASNKQVAIDAILEQLENVKNAQISDTELDSAKKSLKNGYMNIYDSSFSMEAWTLNRELSNNYDTPTTEAKKVLEATKEQIAEFAKGITLDTIYFLKGEDANG